jgi:hypothetical protein
VIEEIEAAAGREIYLSSHNLRTSTMGAVAPMNVSSVNTRKEPCMPTFKLPLSGDVVQSINPFTAFMTGG